MIKIFRRVRFDLMEKTIANIEPTPNPSQEGSHIIKISDILVPINTR